MAGKKKETTLQITIFNQEQWDETMAITGLTVVDVYQAWCGPCKAVISLFRKIKNELGDDLLHFAVAEVDNIDSLQRYRGKCEPTFLFFGGGQLVAVVRGANAPLLQNFILEHLATERKVLDDGGERKAIKDEGLVEEEKEEVTVMQDDEEEKLVTANKSFTVAIIKPDAVAHGKADEIIMKVQEVGFEIICHEERTLTEEEARDLYQHTSEEPHFEELIHFMSSGPCRVLIISKPEGTDDVIPQWREFIGPTDVEIARQEKPESLRALYGTEKLFNAVHGCDDKEQASRELGFFFPNFGASSEAQNLAEPDQRVEKTLALIRPDILKERKDSILQKISEAGLVVALQKEILLTEQQVYEFYREHTEEDYFPALLQNMTSGPVLALALASKDAVVHWRDLLGPKDVSQAKEEAPESLRAQFAVESVPINQLHGSSTLQDAERELNFFFQMEHTLAVIKPDVMENHRDEIIQKIEEGGFVISQMDEKFLSREMAEEFYKEHKGKPFFDKLIDYMIEGPSLMMILSKENAVEEWRSLMGPTDPEEAKKIAPDSLRAKFAKDMLRNSLHGASDQMQATEKIQFIFGDINIGADGIVQGIEPTLEKVIYPEYKEESEDSQLGADAIDSTENAEDNENSQLGADAIDSTENAEDNETAQLGADAMDSTEKTAVDNETRGEPQAAAVDSQSLNSGGTCDESLQKSSQEEAAEERANEEDILPASNDTETTEVAAESPETPDDTLTEQPENTLNESSEISLPDETTEAAENEEDGEAD
ncbi:thioredoxin domain-containing protein 6 isoform X2 [Leucoraja erinacea]|uniref:thioredoxin domain-containing protein 6 isoform X2 n=1 Tax=Leucoraja erinaceus TaxID=7782 RepID=UPI00245839F2|nr:thioredoxin domain-containing protein 6 isoform X2 [Leucoraja erinacea]